MRERVLAIVSFIAQYVLEDKDFLSEGDLVEELLSVGFEAEEIDAAFSWMESLSLQAGKALPQQLQVPSCRIFTSEEKRVLSTEAQGFLARLRMMGILDDEIQEEIIEKALQVSEDGVSLKEIKTITALALFTRSQEDWCREVDCIFEDDWSQLYH